MPFRGRLLDRRLPRRALTAVGLGLVMALSASSVQPVAFADDSRVNRPGIHDADDLVKGWNAKAAKLRKDTSRSSEVKRLHTSSWPRQGRVELAVAETGSTTVAKEAGRIPLSAVAPSIKASNSRQPTKIAVDVLAPERARTLGVAAVLGVARADGQSTSAKVRLNVNYAEFAEGYGGSYASRLRLVQLPACAVVATPGSKGCPEQPKELLTRNDLKSATLSADVTAAPDSPGTSTMTATDEGLSLLAVAAGPASAQGTYKATALTPSASWTVSPSSGGFSWSYPLRSAPTPGGLTPSLGLGYSSQSADGRTSATNNQGSWIGDGFSYDPGYVERRYKPCSDDGHEGSGEQCWAYDNATLMLNGSASELVKDDSTGKWHLNSDNGTKVEKLTGAPNDDNNGEYWKVTTPEGTEYYFGQNRPLGSAAGSEETKSAWTVPVFGDDSGEPCYNATFTSAHCKQAWRWSLDYVKDTHGNVMSYYYEPETNHYALNGKTDVNGTAYHRGGYLKRIDYGQRDGQVYAEKAPARVIFTVAERCLPTTSFDCSADKRTKANASYWPDVPVDQECASGAKCTVGQTFFTTKRLTGITTQIRKDATAYQDVDHWALEHRFNDNGDDSKTLWLEKISHEGRAGTNTKLPSVELFGEQLVNRVDAVGDNIAPFHRDRLATVISETGAQLDINYAPTDCVKSALPAPGASTKRCYPVKWAPPGHIEPITDWFHKYAVAEVIETDTTGGSEQQVTRYDYSGGKGAWRKAEPDGITDTKYLTWGSWQGYDKVKVTSGTADKQTTRLEYTFLQGMNGDKDAAGAARSVKVKDSTGVEYTDHKEFTGHELETVTYDGDKIVARTINEPWKHTTATETHSWNTTTASIVKPLTTRGYEQLSGGGWRETKTKISVDTATGTGRTTTVHEYGDLASSSDDKCTRTWYADNTAENILSLPSRSQSVSVGCSTTPDYKTQILADERTSYDGGSYGTQPTKGDATKTERVTAHDGTTATIQVTGTTTYDTYGRPLTQKDAANNVTKTEYIQTNGLLTQAKVTNALDHVTTTDYAPAWGLSTGQTDPNGKRTDLAHDALGRLTSVWLPDRQKTQTPSIKYAYTLRKDRPTVILTEKIEPSGSYGTEYQLLDSLLRPRQMQTEGPDGTRMVADTWYNGTGKIHKTNATYNAAGIPSTELLLVREGETGAQTRHEYDGLGRTTAEIFAVGNVEQWRTTTTYDGERTHVDPPAGGIASTSITDAASRTTALWHYHGDKPDPAAGYDITKYTHTPGGQLKTVTDTNGNTWSYEYDQLGRKTKAVDPDSGTSTFAYDNLDRLAAVTDSRGKKVFTQYDALYRPTFTWEGEPNTGVKLTETRYDKAGWLGQPYATLRYTSPTEYFATVTQSMDEYYRPLKTAYSVPASQGALAGMYVFTTSYNRDGTVQGNGLPAAGGLPAENIEYGYDALQRPVTMSGTTPYVTHTNYSKRSLVLGLELYAGSGKKVQQTFEYEQGTDRLKTATVDIVGNTALAKRTGYTYDQQGNVLSTADTPGNGATDVQCFRYDDRQRLADAWTPSATATTAAGTGTVGSTELDAGKPSACTAAPGASPLSGPAPYWKSYTTDAIGNRTSDTVHDTTLNAAKDITRTYTYGGAGTLGDGPHQVTKVLEKTPTGDRQSTYEYDAAGNTTKRTIGGNAQNLTWDATGKPTSVKDSAGETTFLYGADGNRVLRKDPKATTVYLPGMELSLAAGSSTVKATRYYSHAGQTVAVRTSDNKLSFLAADHHGTGELAIDAATGAITQRRFDPYGNERGKATGTWPGEKGFIGGTTDASTGLTHLGAREYDPQLGRFISVDPIIEFTRPQQINGYAYASNNPVTLSDPSGMREAECDMGLIDCDSNGPTGKPKGDEGPPLSKEEKEYHQALGRQMGAEAEYSDAKQRTKQAAKQLVKIVRDILGVDAALDCLSTGDIGACGETLLNVAGSFAGGLAGKVLAKYGAPWNWAKGYRLAKKVTGLVDDLISGAKSMWRASKAREKANNAVSAAYQKAADFIRKRKNAKPKCHSFLPGTKVLTKDGKTKPIEDVAPGDKLIVTDPKTGKTVIRDVAGTIVTEDDKHFVDLTITTADGAEPTSLVSTTTHPFWSPSENAWVEAGDLQPGMTLQTTDGDQVTLTATRYFEKRQRTHDLTLTEIHTYYVLAGGTPVLVHNCDLSERASEIHAAEPDEFIRKNVSTVAVIRADTPHGPINVVAGSGDGLTPAQMSAIGKGEIVADNIPGTHAEQNALLFINEMGWSPVAGGTSRNVCLSVCAPLIRGTGGKMMGQVYPGNGKTTTRQRSFEW
ncbi:RHS repeat-associated core domain-containing protein [Streptomyces tendae]|uniref:RHS repeat-associated core domain-containing protein n=1 Tax=Streptomyces tendae TaxID=1932 RepID=UPI0037F95054